MVAECQSTLANGNKCRAIALRGKPHCQHHVPSRRRYAPQRRLRQTALLGTLPRITNRNELQHVLSLTLHALANDTISVCRAQALLSSLQLMAKNL